MSGVEIAAEGLGVDGGRGAVFAGVELHAQPGAVVAIAGPGGSGRTSLLLCLAGRMKPHHGSARVDRHPLPQEAAAVRRLVTVARATGAVELQDRWKVQEAIDLQEVLRGHRIDAREAARVLDACGIEARGDDAIESLAPAQRTRLAIALAWFEGPPAVVVDDVDRGADGAAQRAIWQLLRQLAERGTTVLATTTDAAPASGIADAVVTVGA
jgi:ABC-type multidrug transport system ATPase subunit